MNIFAIISSLFLVALIGGASAENVQASATSNAVALKWKEIPDAEKYYVLLSDDQNQVVDRNETQFGTLLPNTLYQVIISAADVNGTIMANIAPLEYQFRTVAAPVSNLQVMDVTESSIQLTWDMDNETDSYEVMVKNETDSVISASVTLGEHSASISGLQGMQFYKIYITPVGSSGLGDTAMIRTRTDGSGIKLNGVWQGSQGVFGGSATIFRPISIPTGPYVMKIHLPCPVLAVKFWNAKLDKKNSVPADATYVLRQSKLWQRRKAEIGMNFYFTQENETTTCTISGEDINVEFGVSMEAARTTSTNTAVPVIINEWLGTTEILVGSGGMVSILVSEVYNDTNADMTKPTNGTWNAKPDYGTYVIAVDSGAGCTGGLLFADVWGMTRKSSEGMPGALPSTAYFVQDEMQWPSNEMGFLYGYNPEVCEDRSGITAQVMVGGPFVDAVFAAEDA
ncbi:uncharacterized protein LOC143451053 [Clavelina lepadiformis]|uniref:uncharacterized protein LOC143451053 n=1 Tax=Clavelina lepadiformis TaxID=159417 RepID=UPI0040424F5F